MPLVRDPRRQTAVINIGAMDRLVSLARPLKGYARPVASVTRAGAVATVTTAVDHQLETGDRVTVAGAAQTAYNVSRAKVTVTGPKSFTYTVSGEPVTPATGTITATYEDDGTGGFRRVRVVYAANVCAAILPWAATVTGQERVMAAQMTNQYQTEVWMWHRTDVSVKDVVIDEAGQEYRIEATQTPAGTRELIQLLCIEGQA